MYHTKKKEKRCYKSILCRDNDRGITNTLSINLHDLARCEFRFFPGLRNLGNRNNFTFTIFTKGDNLNNRVRCMAFQFIGISDDFIFHYFVTSGSGVKFSNRPFFRSSHPSHDDHSDIIHYCEDMLLDSIVSYSNRLREKCFFIHTKIDTG